MNKKPNPTVIKSRDWIVESFFDLLAIKPLNSITISEITENAELDRRTFYRHFKSKEDVISYSICEASKKYDEAIKQTGVFDNSTIAETFFEVCNNNKEILMILYKQNLLHLLLLDLNLIFQKYQQQFTSSEGLQVKNREYLLAYNVGGFWNLLIKWLADGCKKTPQQMREIVNDIFSIRQICI